MGQEALCNRKAQVDLGSISGTTICMTLGKLQTLSEPKICEIGPLPFTLQKCG